MAAPNVFHFRLDGVDYTLRGNMSREKMAEIVRVVEDKIMVIRDEAPYYSQARAAVLAAIQLSEELIDLKAEYAAFAGEADVGADTLF